MAQPREHVRPRASSSIALVARTSVQSRVGSDRGESKFCCVGESDETEQRNKHSPELRKFTHGRPVAQLPATMQLALRAGLRRLAVLCSWVRILR